MKMLAPRDMTLALCALVACIAQTESRAEPIGDFVESTYFYQDIGNIKWHLPPGGLFQFAVPHFTAGARILCTKLSGAECEVEVSARQLNLTPEQRRSDLVANARPYLADSVEGAAEPIGLGSPTVHYVVLTHKKDGGRIAIGYLAHGPYVIKFRHVARDNDGTKLRRVLSLVQSAEGLNNAEYLAFKLSDTKAACAVLDPASVAQNDEAFRHSPLAGIDYVSHFIAVASPSRTPLEVEASLKRVQQHWLDELREQPQADVIEYCRSFPMQLRSAEE